MKAPKPDTGSAEQHKTESEDKAESEFLLLRMLLERRRIREGRGADGPADDAETCSRPPEVAT